MRATVRVNGQTLAEVQEEAHKHFAAFFGEIPYQVISAMASPTQTMEGHILGWSVDYEAEARP